MNFARAAALIAVVFLATPPAVAQTDDAAKAALKAEDNALDLQMKEVSAEIIAVLDNTNKLDRSADLRREQIASLRIRFPEISVGDDATTSQMLAAMRKYEGQIRERRIVKLKALRTIARKDLCIALGDMRRAATELYASPDWKKLSLAERQSVREPLEAMIADALRNGDPCLPEPPEVAQESMVGSK